MTSREIQMSRTLATQILDSAQKTSAPMAGIVVGIGDECRRFVSISTTANTPDPLTALPSELTRISTTLATPESIVAVVYSSGDREHKAQPPAQWQQLDTQILQFVIVLNTKGVLEIEGYQRQNDQLVPIDLITC